MPLGPNASQRYWKRFDFTPTTLRRFRNNEIDLLCFGFIAYSDVFGREHLTRFCFKFDVGYWLGAGQLSFVCFGPPDWNSYS